MPARSRHIIVGTTTIAFCASLSLHAFVAVTAIEQYASTRIYLPGFDRAAAIESTSDAILIPLPNVVEPRPENLLGKSDGTGSAIDDSPGELPLLARQGEQEQPLLSRDPAGPGEFHAEPSDSLIQPGTALMRTANTSREAFEESIESDREIPFGVGELEPKPTDSTVDRPARASQDAVAVATAVGQAGAPVAPADAAPQAQTESDPFTVVGGVSFRPGGTKAQLGRAHRLVAPRIGLSGLVDGAQIGRVQVVMQITIDQTGNVKSATIFKSSGSDSIDHDCRTAVYQWWLEPKNGADGKPRDEETIIVSITFS